MPPGYVWAPLSPWGTPLLPGAPPFAEDASNTAADQAGQVGFNRQWVLTLQYRLTHLVEGADNGRPCTCVTRTSARLACGENSHYLL